MKRMRRLQELRPSQKLVIVDLREQLTSLVLGWALPPEPVAPAPLLAPARLSVAPAFV